MATSISQIKIGGFVVDNYKNLNDNFDSIQQNKAEKSDVLSKTNTETYTPSQNYNPATKKYVDDAISSSGEGDMLKSVYDTDDNGIVDNAEKVNHKQTITFNNGTTEGTDKFSFDGSADRNVKILAGDNITLTTNASGVTISSNATDTTVRVGTPNIDSTAKSGDIIVGEAATKQVDTNISSGSTNVPTTTAVKSYVDDVVGALSNDTFKGLVSGTGIISSDDSNINGLNINAIANVKAGWYFKVSSTGTIFGTQVVDVGDVAQCVTSYTSADTTGANWIIIQGNIVNAVTSSTTTSVTGTPVAVFDGNNTVIKSSGFTLGKSVPSDAAFTDTVLKKKIFTSADSGWSATASNGLYTFTISNVANMELIKVFRQDSSDTTLYGDVSSTVGIYKNTTNLLFKSYDKFAGYVILSNTESL